jgi:biotin carboxyl carrier protein
MSLAIAGAASAQVAQKPSAQTDADLQVTVAGQVVSIDPKTGRLRPPSPAQQQTLLETLRRITDPVTTPVNVVTHPNGMVSAELPESFYEVSMAKLNADGSLSIDCVKPADVERALASAPAPAPAAAKHTLAKSVRAAASSSDTKRRAAKKSGPTASGDTLASPMQGTIVKVAVEEGAEVKEGDLIVVLEAMKMEQPLNAHRSGTVKGLAAEVGATVSSGAVLCEIKD